MACLDGRDRRGAASRKNTASVYRTGTSTETFVPLNMFNLSKHSFKDRSMPMLILWFIFVMYVSQVPLPCCHVCSLQPYDHLVGKS